MGYPEHLLTDDETVVRQFHPHWRVLLPVGAWGVLLLGVAGAVWYFDGRTPGDDVLAAGPLAFAIAAVLIVLLAIKPVLDWYSKLYVLTTERIVVRSGILSKSGVEIPLENINNVLFSQSLLERMLGYGDVLIESAGSQGQSRLTDIPDPEAFQSAVYRAREDRSMHLVGGGRAADPVDQLERLARMRREGDLTDEEFDTAKRELLGGL